MEVKFSFISEFSHFENTGKEILLILSNLISKSATYITRPDWSQIEHVGGLKMSDMTSLNSK